MTSALDVEVLDAPRREAGDRERLALRPVAKTLLIPLWSRAAEMAKRRPLVHDPRAREICDSIDFDFSVFRRSYGTQVGCVLRGLLYDRWVLEFLARHPEGTIVELGAGLSTRFERIDNGRARWVDVDLPDAMALRRRFFAPGPRRTFVAASVTGDAWIEELRRVSQGPCFFVSEGMLMYLREADVRALLVRIADAFGPCDVALDSIAPVVVRQQRHHDSMKHMLDAPFGWGIEDVRQVERWDARFMVREVATLADIAGLFADRVPLSQRVVGALFRHALPSVAAFYRLSRISLRSR